MAGQGILLILIMVVIDTMGEVSLSSEFDIESGTWKPLKEAFSATSQPPFSFSNAEIINYFKMRKAVDGLPASK